MIRQPTVRMSINTRQELQIITNQTRQIASWNIAQQTPALHYVTMNLSKPLAVLIRDWIMRVNPQMWTKFHLANMGWDFEDVDDEPINASDMEAEDPQLDEIERMNMARLITTSNPRSRQCRLYDLLISEGSVLSKFG